MDGDQNPVIPFGETAFKIGGVLPLQIARVVAKFGIIEFVTVTTKVIGEAHCPEFGVKI